jgi:hypothetical protein
MPPDRSGSIAERLKLLTQTGRDTEMGRLLRMFWQPVATSHSFAAGSARPLRVLGEDLTLYRGESGSAHLVAGRCAIGATSPYRLVQGEDIHACITAGAGDAAAPGAGPSEDGASGSSLCCTICRLIFAIWAKAPRPAAAAQGGVRAIDVIVSPIRSGR